MLWSSFQYLHAFDVNCKAINNQVLWVMKVAVELTLQRPHHSPSSSSQNVIWSACQRCLFYIITRAETLSNLNKVVSCCCPSMCLGISITGFVFRFHVYGKPSSFRRKSLLELFAQLSASDVQVSHQILINAHGNILLTRRNISAMTLIKTFQLLEANFRCKSQVASFVIDWTDWIPQTRVHFQIFKVCCSLQRRIFREFIKSFHAKSEQHWRKLCEAIWRAHGRH